jgi:hypothetical protein
MIYRARIKEYLCATKGILNLTDGIVCYTLYELAQKENLY